MRLRRLFKRSSQKKQKQKEHLRSVLTSGISVNETGKTVNLRPERTLFEQVIEAVFDSLNRNKRKLGLVAVLLCMLVVLGQAMFVNADIAIFHPSSCLGGWTNPQNAEGAPQIIDGDTSKFDDTNSAYLVNSISQMFCGGFQGELPKDSEPKKVVLKLSWALKIDPEIPTGSSSSETPDVIDSGVPLEEPVVVDPNEDFSSSENNASNPILIEAPAEESVEPAPVEPAPSEPTSFFFEIFAGNLYAAEINTTDSTTSIETIPVEVPDVITPPTDDHMFTVLYTLDGKSWSVLGTINSEEIGKKDFEIPIDNIVSEASLADFQINIQSNTVMDQNVGVYLDGMSLEVEYDKTRRLSQWEIDRLPRITIGDEEVFDSEKKDFRSNESPEFEINLFESATVGGATTTVLETPLTPVVEVSTTTEEIIPVPELVSPTEESTTTVSLSSTILKGFAGLFIATPVEAEEVVKRKVIKAEIYGPDGSLYKDAPIIDETGDKVKISIPTAKTIRPGKYKMYVEVLSDDKVLVTTREFGWGVLAINTDKSSYSPGESAFIQMGVLTPEGHTLCNTNLQLEISGPNGIETLSTANGKIKRSTTCGKNNVTDNPDYYASFTTGGAGIYGLKLSNLDNGYVIRDSLLVSGSSDFVVERQSATRINPFASTYVMSVDVKARRAFSGQIRESLPEGFEISSTTGAVSTAPDGSIIITWGVTMEAGEIVPLKYTYQSPLISPELFLVGPLIFEDGTGDPFIEERSWQIASDGACNAITTGSWDTGANWSAGCSGVGGIPDATDTVTINSGVTITLNSNAAAASITVANAAASSNGIALNGYTLTVGGGTGTIAMTASTGAGISTLAVGTGTLTSGTITIPGGASTGATILSVSTGTMNITGNITPSGTAARAQITFTGAGTINISGNFGSGGTLAGSTGRIVFNGGSAQTIGIYTTYNNIEIANTSGGVTILGTTTFGGTLTITSGTLTVGAFTLTVTGATSVTGTLTISSTTGTKTFGALTINTGGVMNFSAAEAVTMNGNLQVDGTGSITGTTGVFTFQKVGGGTISGSASSIAITSGTFTTSHTVSTPLTLTGTLTVTGGAVVVTNNTTVTVTTALSGTGGFTQGTNAILNLGGTSAITTLTATASGNVVNYNDTGAQTIKAITYVTLKVNNTSATGAILPSAGVTLTTLTIGDTASTAYFADGGFTITLSGSSVLNLTQGTYKIGSATVANAMTNFATKNISSGTTIEYGSGIAQSVDHTLAYQNISFTGVGTKTPTGGLTIPGNLTVNAASQTVNLVSYTHSITGNVVVTAGTLDGDTSNISVQGSWTGAGTFTGDASTVTFTGTAAQTISVTTDNFFNLTVNKTSNTVTTGAAVNVLGVLNVDDGNFTIAGFATTITGATNITDTLTINDTTGTKTFISLVTINSGGIWDNSGNSTATFRGGITHNGTTFNGGTGVQTFDTNNQALGGSTAISIPRITVTGVTLTNNTVGLTVGTALAGTGELAQTTNSILNLGGTSAITTLTAAASGNTVSYTGAAQTVKPISYVNLGLSGSGAKTMTSVSTISGNLNVSGTLTAATAIAMTVGGNINISGGTFTVGAFDFSVTGTSNVSSTGIFAHSSASGAKTHVGRITLSSGGTWTNAGDAAFTLRGGLTVNSSTFTSGTGVYTFDANSQDITTDGTVTIGSVTVTGVTLTNNNTLTVSTALSGTGGLTQGSSSTLNLSGTTGITTLTATASGNVVNYNGAAAQTIKGTTYKTLKINNAHASGATLGADTTVETLTIGDVTAASIFLDGGFVIAPSGSSVLNLTQGTFKLGSASVGSTFPAFSTLNIAPGTTVQYLSAVAQTISGTPNYQNLTFTGVGTKTANGGLNVAGNLTVNAASQTVNLSSYTHSVTGNVVITAGTLDGDTSNLSIQGSWTGAGTFTGDASTVTFTGTAAQTISVNTDNFYNLVIDKTSNTVTVSDTLNVLGALTITDGELSIGAVSSTITGATNITDTLTITSSTGTKTFVGLVTIDSGGVWNNSGNEAPFFRGGLLHNGATFTAGTGVHTFNTNTQNIGGSSAISIPSITVTGVGLSLINDSAAGLTVSTALSGTGIFTNGVNALLNIGGTSGISQISSGATGSTVNYTGAAQTVISAVYQNLFLSGSGAKTMTSGISIFNDLTLSGTVTASTTESVSVAGNLTVGSGTALTYFGGNISGTTSVSGTIYPGIFSTFTGAVIINTGGNWYSSGSMSFRNGITHNGTNFISSAGTFTFDTNNQSIGGSGTITISGMAITGIILTNNSTVGLTTGGPLNGTGEFRQGANAVLNIGGNSVVTTFTTTASGNVIKYSGTDGVDQTVRATTYHHLIIDRTPAASAILGGNTIVNGDLTISNGTLDLSSGNNYSLSVKGNWTNNGTFTPRLGTVTFNGTGNQAISGATTWYGLSILASSTRTVTLGSGVAQTISANGNLTLAGEATHQLTLSPGTPASSWLLTVNNTGVTQNVRYVTPSYSDASGGAAIIATDGTNSDGGNNTNWTFASLSCSVDQASIGLGTLDPGSVSSASPVATLTTSCGSVAGCSVFVQDSGNSVSPGLYAASATSTPLILSVSGTLSAGTEGYGIQAATTTNGSGNTLLLSSTYNKTGNAVGALTLSNSTVATSTGSFTSREIVITPKAAIALVTKSGNYTDTLTYSCIGN